MSDFSTLEKLLKKNIKLLSEIKKLLQNAKASRIDRYIRENPDYSWRDKEW